MTKADLADRVKAMERAIHKTKVSCFTCTRYISGGGCFVGQSVCTVGHNPFSVKNCPDWRFDMERFSDEVNG